MAVLIIFKCRSDAQATPDEFNQVSTFRAFLKLSDIFLREATAVTCPPLCGWRGGDRTDSIALLGPWQAPLRPVAGGQTDPRPPKEQLVKARPAKTFPCRDACSMPRNTRARAQSKPELPASPINSGGDPPRPEGGGLRGHLEVVY